MEEAVTHQYYRFDFEGGEGGNSNGAALRAATFRLSALLGDAR